MFLHKKKKAKLKIERKQSKRARNLTLSVEVGLGKHITPHKAVDVPGLDGAVLFVFGSEKVNTVQHA